MPGVITSFPAKNREKESNELLKCYNTVKAFYEECKGQMDFSARSELDKELKNVVWLTSMYDLKEARECAASLMAHSGDYKRQGWLDGIEELDALLKEGDKPGAEKQLMAVFEGMLAYMKEQVSFDDAADANKVHANIVPEKDESVESLTEKLRALEEKRTELAAQCTQLRKDKEYDEAHQLWRFSQQVIEPQITAIKSDLMAQEGHKEVNVDEQDAQEKAIDRVSCKDFLASFEADMLGDEPLFMLDSIQAELQKLSNMLQSGSGYDAVKEMLDNYIPTLGNRLNIGTVNDVLESQKIAGALVAQLKNLSESLYVASMTTESKQSDLVVNKLNALENALAKRAACIV
jgi:hypothetical protein